jgi:hypothetical protein
LLSSTANQLQSQQEYKQQSNMVNRPKQTNKKNRIFDELNLFKCRHEFLKISVDLQTAVVVEAS